MNTCKNCGNEYEGTYCPECGVRFDILCVCKSCGTAFSGKYCPECGVRFLPIQICASCGNKFVGRFCSECGVEYVTPVLSSDASDVTLSGYGEVNDAATVIPTSIFGYDDMSFEKKEENVLRYVKSLIERELFEEAGKWLDQIEEEEIASHGKASAAIYYFKILCENMTSSPDEIAEKYTEAGIDLKFNTNYILAMSSDDSPEKSEIIKLDKRVEGILRDKELYRQAEEKKKREEEERKAKEKREVAERLEKEKLEAAEAKKREEEERLGLKSSEGLKYEKSRDGYVITGVGTCHDTDIVIPSRFKGEPVTGVGKGAFIECGRIKSVHLPESVTRIGETAFKNCSSLVSINFPEALTSIGKFSFSGCLSLAKISIPENVNKIGEYAFDYCTKLKSVKIPNGVTEIEEGIFYDCSDLRDVTLPDNLSSIGFRAFWGCDKLYKVFLPVSLKEISTCVFHSYVKCYYLGSAYEWGKIKDDSHMSYKVYFYSESRPRMFGNFYHYNEDGIPEEW